jgi:UDP:flavonoid glycosyltransferase YjiC (YdhE family)
MFGQINGKLAQLCRTYNVPPFTAQDTFLGAEPLTIVFIPKEFQPGGETFDERFVFVGPSLQDDRQDSHNFPLLQYPTTDRKDEENLTPPQVDPDMRHANKTMPTLSSGFAPGKTTLYISLGTVFNNQSEFYNMCFAAFKDEPWLVVLSRGKNVDPATLDATPANFLVSPHVPQLEVLQHTSVFVTHGGMNSTMESLYYGIPMVVVPQMPEQQMTARHIQERGLGIALDKNTVTAEQLRTTVTQVMTDPAYRIRAQAMEHYTRAAGGYKRAADAIINFEQTHRQTTPNNI